MEVLGVWRVDDLLLPRAGSVKGHYCSECKAEVWVMPRNFSASPAFGSFLMRRSSCFQGSFVMVEPDGIDDLLTWL